MRPSDFSSWPWSNTSERWSQVTIDATVEPVGSQNLDEVNSYLTRHEVSSQFLINNMRNLGPRLTEHPNSGNFKAIRKNGKIVSVFSLARRGNLVIHSTESEPDLVLVECAKEPVSLRGFIGEWSSVEPVYQLYRSRNPSYSPTYESKEILYAYDLKAEDPRIQFDSRVRRLKPSEFSQWQEFSKAYMAELSLPDDLSLEQQRTNFESQVAAKTCWGMFDGEKLISRTALNSNGEKIGQVGGVFTPKQYRKRGFAKAVMFHMLKDCRDLHGHRKSILFTGETDIPAQKLYESMGYGRIGSFALILGN